jgi:hypothetical protein
MNGETLFYLLFLFAIIAVFALSLKSVRNALKHGSYVDLNLLEVEKVQQPVKFWTVLSAKLGVALVCLMICPFVLLAFLLSARIVPL